MLLRSLLLLLLISPLAFAKLIVDPSLRAPQPAQPFYDESILSPYDRAIILPEVRQQLARHAHLKKAESVGNIQKGPRAVGRYPFIFVHGLGVKGKIYQHIINVRKMLAKAGFESYIVDLPMGGTIEEAAEMLRQQIKAMNLPSYYHLIGHSRGGLVARYAISLLGLYEHCLSLTTMGTPHRGSPLADVVLEFATGKDRFLGHQTAKMLMGHLMGVAGFSNKTIEQLTPAYMESEFNPNVLNHPDVEYYNIGVDIKRPVILNTLVPVLSITHGIIQEREAHKTGGKGGNDGIVSIYSAEGQGESIPHGFYGDHYTVTSCPYFLDVADKVKKRFEPVPASR